MKLPFGMLQKLSLILEYKNACSFLFLFCAALFFPYCKKTIKKGKKPYILITAMIHISVPYWQLTLLFFIMGQKMKKPSRQGREVSEG